MRRRLPPRTLIRSTFFRLCLGACLLCPAPLFAGIEAGVKVTDDTGRPIHLAAPARRIVSLAPHLTELVFAAGAGDYLVGVDSASDYPATVRQLPRVGGLGRIDLERLLQLHPDLILVWHSGTSTDRQRQLESLGAAVFVSQPRTLEGIADTIERLAKLAGTLEQGRHRAAIYRQRLAALHARYAGRPPLRVFYQIWDQPLITINGEHVISDAIRLCGGHNIFADLPALAPRVSIEAVLAANPRFIATSDGARGNGDPLARWKDWPALAANHVGGYLTLPADHISRYTPRILDGVEKLCEAMDAVRRSQ